MKTISQYQDDIKNLMKKVGDIDAQATMESRDLRDDEILLKNEILDTVEELSKTVNTLNRQERVTKTLETPEPTQTVEKKRPAMSVQVKDKEKFHTIGEQMVAVMRAGMPGGHINPRLYNAATGLNETSPSDGGLR
jgi:hypothetical protein